jgi:hypothetical protein
MCDVTSIIIIIIIICIIDSCHRRFLPGTSLEPAAIPTAQASCFTLLHTAVLSVLCVMFQVRLSFVLNLLNVFLVWLLNFFYIPFVTIPVAPIITGIINQFMFRIP